MEKDKGKNEGSKKDREEYGYGYDKSVDDLKVIGKNRENENEKDKK
ncbi:hypothetical protein ACXYMX_07720 [Sporosarcina sp. CAU 1771]